MQHNMGATKAAVVVQRHNKLLVIALAAFELNTVHSKAHTDVLYRLRVTANKQVGCHCSHCERPHAQVMQHKSACLHKCTAHTSNQIKDGNILLESKNGASTTATTRAYTYAGTASIARCSACSTGFHPKLNSATTALLRLNCSTASETISSRVLLSSSRPACMTACRSAASLVALSSTYKSHRAPRATFLSQD